MSLQETIDNILISTPEDLRYSKLSSFFETFFLTNTKDLLRILNVSYLYKKFENLEDLLLISLLYKTFLSLNSSMKTAFYTFENEKNTLNRKLKDRLKALSEAKILQKLCFCDILKPNFSEKNSIFPQINKQNSFEISLEKARNNIKILYSELFQPLLLGEDYFGASFRFLGKIFLKWALILEVSFESEELLLTIDLMKNSINPKLYQSASSLWCFDLAKFFNNLKFIMKFAIKKNSENFAQLEKGNSSRLGKGNIAVFFEVFTEDDMRRLVRDSWDLLKKFIENKEEIAIKGIKGILEVCFTRKTLRFFLEVTKTLKKEEDARRMKGFYQEVVIGIMMDRLKGKFFGEVLEILKIYVFGKKIRFVFFTLFLMFFFLLFFSFFAIFFFFLFFSIFFFFRFFYFLVFFLLFEVLRGNIC